MEIITQKITYHFEVLYSEKSKCTVSVVDGMVSLCYHLSSDDCFYKLDDRGYLFHFLIHKSYFEKYDDFVLNEVSLSSICILTQTRLYELTQCNLEGSERKVYIESLILFLIVQLNKKQSDNCNTCNVLRKRLKEDRIETAKNYILKNISDSLTISTIASAVGTNDCYLKEGFKAYTGKTIFEFIQEHRMLLAQCLLQNSQKSIQEIAIEVGYSSISSFSQSFKKYFGMSPKVYSQKNFSNF